MAGFNKKKLLEQAKEIIDKHKLIFTQDVIAYMPCNSSTFYKFFPADSEEMESLKELTTKNKIQIKSSLRSKWYKSDAPALQLALYKLTASKEELRALSMQALDHTTDGEKINREIDYSKLSDEALREIANATGTQGEG